MAMLRARQPDASSGSQRIVIACAAFCMQLALGAVYGWSVFLNPLREHFGASKVEVSLTFTITLAVLGITAGFGGSLQRRIGPRATASLAGLLYGSGVLLSGIAPNLATLYLAHGVLGGVGLGLGYIVPLAVLIGWFPDKRGFITGLAVMGFGFGALVTGPLATGMIASLGVQSTLMMLGATYLVIVVIAAQFMRSAPENYAPPGWIPPARQALRSDRDMTLIDALRTPHWYLLWLMLALNVTAGAALISVAAPLTQEFTQVGPALGAITVCLISLFNGLGRLFWGTLSDRIGRTSTFLALFLLQTAAFALLAGIGSLRGVPRAGCRHRAVLRRRLRHHAGLRHGCVRCEERRSDLRCHADSLERRCDRRTAPHRSRPIPDRVAIDCRRACDGSGPATRLSRTGSAQ